MEIPLIKEKEETGYLETISGLCHSCLFLRRNLRLLKKNYKYDKSTNRHKVNREIQDKIICCDEVKGGGRDYMKS